MMSLKRLLLFSLLFFLPSWVLSATHWTTLAQDLQYTILLSPVHDGNHSGGKLHAFRIDLHHYTLGLRIAKNLQQTSLFTDQLSTEKNVLLAINGGFFSPDLQSMGLRINNGQLLNPLKKISWWGIFLIQNNQAKIVLPSAYQHSPQDSFAIQAGPRLIINGIVAKLHGGEAQRSALCITKTGKVIAIVTEHWSLSTEVLAKMLSRPEKDNGLDCYQALNLDGGTSSQLYANINDFILHVRSIRPVADAIVVTSR